MKDIDYFDPQVNVTEDVIVKDWDMIYWNIFFFTNWVWVKAITVEPSLVCQNLDFCLLDQADKWYTEELSHIQWLSLYLDINRAEKWCKTLELHFWDLSDKLLTMLETTHYTMKNAQKNCESAFYIQFIVVNEWNAEIVITDHTQILLVYEHLNSKLWLTLTELTSQTTVAQFIEQLNFKKHTWFKIYEWNWSHTAMQQHDRGFENRMSNQWNDCDCDNQGLQFEGN